MKIVNVPGDVLNKRSKPVRKFDAKIAKLAADMITTLEKQTDPPGVGLAASQVGVRLQLFVIKPMERSRPKVFVNPKIMKLVTHNVKRVTQGKKPASAKAPADAEAQAGKSKGKATKLEGCLSIPRIWGKVDRAGSVLVTYHDISGKKHEDWFSGFEAVIIQHEMDHLKGILFTERVLEQSNKLFREKDGELEEYSI